MNEDRWRRLRALFDEVAEMSEEARGAFLDRELANEPELRTELEDLLAAEATASGFLAGGKARSTPGGESYPGPGSHVGQYHLLELLGEGGFGIVYLAEQLRPIRRRVALKLIKPGMDTKQVIARFEAERQALALMDHPGIAQVFDAGETESGRPYFVMEHVPGVRITDFCDRERLRIRERLDLFLKVCDAVQHAHQKGVIHRDLKPSNVLVAMRDGVPTPKVIDFGIVKATTAPLDDRSFETREGMILGTLGYMSPEQIGAGKSEVDTRSDIYSLGVLLYELLAGELPFDKARLRRAAWEEAVRVIREEDPPGMTSRVGAIVHDPESSEGSTSRISEIAQMRSVDERGLINQLRGELEWITLRALEKEPDRRYASASEFSADIRRHLANEPVLAGPPSAVYRMRKFARRHRAGVAAAAVALAAIVAGGVAAGIGFHRAVLAEQAARREAESARRVSDFLVEIFRTASPDRSRGETVTARTLLDQGTERIRLDKTQDPHVRARLLTTLGYAHLNLGFYDEAVALLREGLAESESARPRDDVEVAGQLRALAYGLRAQGKRDEIEPLLNRALGLAEAAKDPPASLIASCLADKAALYNERSQLDAADSLIGLVVVLAESEERPDTLRLIRTYNTKANLAHRRYQLENAERDYLRALEYADAMGTQPSWSVQINRNLASLYGALGRPDDAMRHAQESVRLARAIYAPGHPNVAEALSGLAAALMSGDKFEEAASVREEALEILRHGGARTDLATQLNSLGILYRMLGKHDLAIARTEESFELNREIDGLEHGRTPETLGNLARCYQEAGRVETADSLFRAAIPLLEAIDPTNVHTVTAYIAYANLARDTGRFAKADSLFERAEAAIDTTSTGMRMYYFEGRTDRAYLRSLEGRHAEAETMMRGAFDLADRDSVPEGEMRILGYTHWAVARARAGDAEGAIEILRRAVRCGVTSEALASYPEIAALRAREDYPAELRK